MEHPWTLRQANVEDLKAQLRTLRLELGEADRGSAGEGIRRRD